MEKLMADVNMGDNLRKLRKENGFTQDHLVARLGILGLSITRSLYSRYETGELNIPISLLIALREIYGCGYEAFFQDLKLKNADPP